MKRVFLLLLIAMLIPGLITGCGSPGFSATDIDPQFSDGIGNFAFDFFKELNKEDAKENIFISPLSISSALTMAFNGAETSTKNVMEKALGYAGLDRALINRSYKSLLDHLKVLDKKITLDIANSIWIREGMAIQKPFIDINKQYFDARVEVLDFNKAQAADQINDWINKATKGKISKMVNPPIPFDVIMYLFNAIYFKGQWSKTFDPKNTSEAAFNAYDGSVNTVQMMHRKASYEYASNENYKAIRLPYGTGKTSMNIILPNEGVDINDFINSLSLEKWREIQDSISMMNDVILEMPKFKIEYGTRSLNNSLMALGMNEAFSSNADFSGMGKDIMISNVFHKAVIEVNEEGSEAAAVTGVEMVLTAAAEPITFIVNRPFIFLITDDANGTILFMGKVLSL